MVVYMRIYNGYPYFYVFTHAICIRNTLSRDVIFSTSRKQWPGINNNNIQISGMLNRSYVLCAVYETAISCWISTTNKRKWKWKRRRRQRKKLSFTTHAVLIIILLIYFLFALYCSSDCVSISTNNARTRFAKMVIQYDK